MAFQHNIRCLHVTYRVHIEDGVAVLKVANRNRRPSESERTRSKQNNHVAGNPFLQCLSAILQIERAIITFGSRHKINLRLGQKKLKTKNEIGIGTLGSTRNMWHKNTSLTFHICHRPHFERILTGKFHHS